MLIACRWLNYIVFSPTFTRQGVSTYLTSGYFFCFPIHLAAAALVVCLSLYYGRQIAALQWFTEV